MYRPDKAGSSTSSSTSFLIISIWPVQVFLPHIRIPVSWFLYFCSPITSHTDRTKGAVRVMIPQFIPTIWNMTDNNTAHDAHKNPFQLLSPKAMAHKTPLYPINPAFKLPAEWQ